MKDGDAHVNSQEVHAWLLLPPFPFYFILHYKFENYAFFFVILYKKNIESKVY